MAASSNVTKVLESQLMQAAQVIEERLDSQIERLDNLKEDDIEQLRERRLRQMKEQAKQRDEWVASGHGRYFEISNEKEFFEEGKRSKNLVCHFYRDSTFRCKIFDKHLAIIAQRHLECKFIKLSVDKAPFLTQRLKIRVIPTLCIVREEKTKDYVVGFEDLGGRDEFSTEMLEWRLGRSEVIDYKGDLMNPPDQLVGAKSGGAAGASSILGAGGRNKKTVRGGGDDDSSDDNDW